jgi:hypothetical protein
VRSILVLTFLFLSSFTFAQSDSTQLKLEIYKKWYESGLITQDEYSDLKKNLLKVSPSNTTKGKDSTKVKSSAYKGKIRAGSVFTIVGLGTFLGARIYLEKAVKATPMDKLYAKNIESINYNYKFLRGAGIGLGIIGIGLLTVGIATKEVVLANGNSVLIDIPNLLLVYRF